MKHIIILGDGMADWSVPSLGGKTLLQAAHTPNMDRLAMEGLCLVVTPLIALMKDQVQHLRHESHQSGSRAGTLPYHPS